MTDLAQIIKLVPEVRLETDQDFVDFKEWQLNDGSLAGLLALLEKQGIVIL